MAIYKFFPIKDATLYSAFPDMNTGGDAILEVYNLNLNNTSSMVARTIISFNQPEINNWVSNLPHNNYKVYLKLYMAEAQKINQQVNLEIALLSGSWDNGSGQYNDSPQTKDGVSWNYRMPLTLKEWINPGGDYLYNYSQSLFYDYNTIKDLSLDVTDMFNHKIISGDGGSSFTDGGYGFIIKLSDDQEFISSSNFQPHLKFFSVDTNTIYPPCLELRWDDFTTSSNAPTEISIPNLSLSLNENPGVFYPESVNRFRLNVRPTYPTRTFQTASLYTTNYSLPTASYYAIKDLDTNEYVVDFDYNYTKISNDDNGSYFDVYMNGLEPERYYKILIQTTVNNTTLVKDDNYIFKVING